MFQNKTIFGKLINIMNILIKTTPEWAVNLFPFLNYCLNKFLDLPNWLQQLCNSTSDHVFSYSFVSNPTCHNIKKQIP